jgi:uncharacterized protein (DUF2235 family)
MMPRNLVVFADGTGQSGGSKGSTNVYHLFRMAEDRTPHQLCYYDQGVGTAGMDRALGLASGRGFGRNVRACYRFLFENFQAGDRIFLIGFSRGAATLRSLASFIDLFGILPRSRAGLIEQAWRIYTIHDERRREARAREMLAHHPTMWTTIHFLGCFDTVVALGSPYQWASAAIDRIPGFKHRFHDMRLSPGVLHAYHALALDDARLTFHPALWDALEEEGHRGEEEGDAPRRELRAVEMRQVWFAGMHTDVGGGYPSRALSDIPLVWMADMAMKNGFRVFPRHGVAFAEDHDGRMHDSRAGLGAIYRRRARAWDSGRRDRPVVHESATLRRKGVGNADDPPYALPFDEGAYEVEPWVRADDRLRGGAGIPLSAEAVAGVVGEVAEGAPAPG